MSPARWAILMQRLVTSSTAAIRTTLERRLLALDTPQPQQSLFEAMDEEDWVDLDGQAQVDLAVQAGAGSREVLERERSEVEALLELIYKLQQEENDPQLKVLIFTEFVPTQAMLSEFLEHRGFSVAQLNGGMDLEARTPAQQAFAGEVRVLVSTDAGGDP